MSGSVNTSEPPAGPVRQLVGAYAPVFALLAILVVGDLAIATVVDASSDAAGGLVVGIVFSQIVLLATWTALGPARIFVRSLTGFAGAALVAFVLVACIANSGVSESRSLWFRMALSQWLAIQVPLWALRGFGWRLYWPGERIERSSPADRQFGIWQLMVWTAVVAATLGIGRWLLASESGFLHPQDKRDLALYLVITGSNCLLAWPVIWATMARGGWPLWLLVAAVCCVVLTLVETWILGITLGGSGDGEFFWILNGVQFLTASVSLLAVRQGGFRLARRAR